MPATCAMFFGRHSHDFNVLCAQVLRALLLVLLLEGSGKIHLTKGQGNQEETTKFNPIKFKAMRRISQED